MTTNTILLIFLSLIVAAGLSFYQYFYKAGNRSKVNLLLAFLRFITIFGILILLINPLITTKSYEVEKTPLAIVIDNSASIEDLGAKDQALKIYKEITSNSALQEKYDIQSFGFDSEFASATEFTFNGKQTDLEKVANNLQSINKGKNNPTVLVTDGNQTTGNDFVYAFDGNNKVYPVVLGDTTIYTDIKISRVNVNKYAFHKNKFPVEVFVQYSGNKNISADFTISKGNSIVHRQKVALSGTTKSAIVNLLLPAEQTGLQVYKATFTSTEAEKNTYNNSKDFAVQVIDQKTEVAIISAINHPDLGSLKRSIESNSQRKVTILKPENVTLQDFDVLIFYQPTAAFKAVFEKNNSAGINSWIITGTSTDFIFLNSVQGVMEFKMSSQKEDYLPVFDTKFNLFALDDLGFGNFPPLQHPYGTVKMTNSSSVLLSSKIRNINTDLPLLAFAENKVNRTAYLLGENIWRWRLHFYADHKSFEDYDIFIDKTIQYLATNQSKKSLVVNHENFYNSGDAIEINAQFFNKNYEFDEQARLSISVTNRETKAVKLYDLLKSTNSFKVNLDGLAAGKYDFSVKELNTNTVYNSFFEILDFDIEKQFVNPDLAKLSELAARTDSKVFYPNTTDKLIKMLADDPSYKAIQREIVKKIPLIESVWIFIILCISLACEWFIRKYNGLL